MSLHEMRADDVAFSLMGHRGAEHVAGIARGALARIRQTAAAALAQLASVIVLARIV
jgi:hypothetical protein